MAKDLTKAELAVCAFAALLIGALSVAAFNGAMAHGVDVFIARTIAGLAGCF